MSQRSALYETSLRKHPQEAEFSELLEVWDYWDDNGTNADARAALCLEDRYYLLINVLHRTDAWNQWIFDRCREVEKDPDGHIDIWARGHYKSTIITYAGVIQEILKDPEITVGIFSHTHPIAAAFLNQIKREFEANDDLRELFPEILYENPERDSPCWSQNSGIIVKRQGNPKEATIEAHGLVDGQPTSRHFKLMVYDDVVTDKSVYTPEQIKRTTESWSLSNNLASLTGTRRWYIGTRYSYADTYAEIIKRKVAQLRKHPATKNGLFDGEPVLLSKEDWAKKKKTELESTIACQSLCNPQAGNQCMFNVEDLREYEVRPLTLMAYLMIDPARTVKKDSANTSMVVIGIDKNGNKYLLDGIDHKIDLTDRWRWMRDLWEKWVNAPGIQGLHVGYEKFGAQADMDYFHEQMRDPRGVGDRVNFDIIELEWPREGNLSKIDRVQRLTPDIKNHRFFVPYRSKPDNPHPENLTASQRKMKEEGFGYRISEHIEYLDENGEKYDLTENFKMQVSAFPFGGRVDVIDAVSRIYDMEPRRPEVTDQSSLEPDYV